MRISNSTPCLSDVLTISICSTAHIAHTGILPDRSTRRLLMATSSVIGLLLIRTRVEISAVSITTDMYAVADGGYDAHIWQLHVVLPIVLV